ncbi:protein transport protein SEC61 subunit beta [Malassezia restricta]|uniref:Protein transport protein Sec61 subunit beta n=1 Tax=Malassezia restricta (strain ATCC 96810 / NBRC 103918 / CBS 7877) TaxID=425264 RepID=A0A3G2S444_MALR7|nr:protein transport protein SEC61 subunit beta [Malassezia restricta]AXA50204.1 protein transport protein SEC61 subunit beta [Malassezia restricta]AYO42863.1 Protein transport protein Sec61 subunit beta [Malassezia restricta CBS 7877]
MSEKKQGTHTPLTQAQLAALASRNSSAMRRKAAVQAANKPHSTREAGAGGSTNTMMRINTEDSKGLSVDPVIVLVLSVAFVLSVVLLHILGKVARYFIK